MMKHFTNTVNGWNPGRTSKMKLFAKVVNGWSLCQISQLELFGKIFNRLNPCQTSKMELVQKQLSDEVRASYLSRMEPFVKIVNSSILAFGENWWNSCQTSKMESFAKILNGWNLSQTSNMNILRIGYFAKSSIFDVWQGSECASECLLIFCLFYW